MHMADALLSPAVGVSLWAGTAAVGGYASKKLKVQITDRTIPLMGFLGAFIFAAQMINFTIPGTGSSGHLGGGMILAILLGPHAAFLTMASVLTVQALFFRTAGFWPRFATSGTWGYPASTPAPLPPWPGPSRGAHRPHPGGW